ncbi:wd40 repeat family [Anaeramoeba flamelloides]|uniref:Wd40 repeat family n=1 Tax=Anaeramoeba flamelloides TaxID=1746091 RepID=A0ABQ8XDK0_9EUKA|nr:wd40 repeat family [Anaeramoeba flamelloides]
MSEAYILFIINKSGGVIYTQTFSKEIESLNANKVMILGSTFHSLYTIAQTVSPVPESSGIEELEVSNFKVSCYQSVTGTKFFITTDLSFRNPGQLLKRIYLEYAKSVLVSPFYQPEQPIKNVGNIDEINNLQQNTLFNNVNESHQQNTNKISDLYSKKTKHNKEKNKQFGTRVQQKYEPEDDKGDTIGDDEEKFGVKINLDSESSDRYVDEDLFSCAWSTSSDSDTSSSFDEDPYLYDESDSQEMQQTDELELEWVLTRKDSCRFVILHHLENQSLTTQWIAVPENENLQHIILGTNLVKNNHLVFAQFKFHKEKRGLIKKTKKIVKIKTTPHESEVNRVSINPKNNDILATKAGNNSVYIFNKENDEYKYQYTCSGHKNEGYGISWNPYHPELLLSGSYDSLICIWDINKPNSTEIDPLKTYKNHSKDIEDVQWHPFNGNVFGSVADDKTLKIFDIRKENPTIDIKAHDEEVNSISFHPDNQHFLLTASSDKTIRLWDLRKIEKSIHTFKSHQDKVYKVCWNPHYSTTFASSGDDKRIHIWDINRIGDEKNHKINHNHPTELVFTNYGHRSVIRDFCWSPTIPWTLSSIDDNSLNQIWRVKKKSIFKEKNILTETEIEY